MRELLRLLDEDLLYIEHMVEPDIIIIRAESSKTTGICPYCGVESTSVHSVYERKLQDLPIQGKKTVLLINRRKFFCLNKDCKHRTFAEQFCFLKPCARKTDRLQTEILAVSLTQSSLSASKFLRRNVANVGKSTICNLLKKRNSDNE